MSSFPNPKTPNPSINPLKTTHPINPGEAIFDFLVLTWKVCVFLALYILGGITLAIIFGIRGKRKRRAKELQKPAERTLEK